MLTGECTPCPLASLHRFTVPRPPFTALLYTMDPKPAAGPQVARGIAEYRGLPLVSLSRAPAMFCFRGRRTCGFSRRPVDNRGCLRILSTAHPRPFFSACTTPTNFLVSRPGLEGACRFLGGPAAFLSFAYAWLHSLSAETSSAPSVL
jgi:hypothetical protein